MRRKFWDRYYRHLDEFTDRVSAMVLLLGACTLAVSIAIAGVLIPMFGIVALGMTITGAFIWWFCSID